MLGKLGDSTKRESLEVAQVHREDEIFVKTGSDECNFECVIEISDTLKQFGRKNWF